MKQWLKHIYHAVTGSKRLVVLDYPVELKPLYPATAPQPELYQLISAGNDRYAQLLQQCLTHAPVFKSLAYSSDQPTIEPVWHNDFVPGLDLVLQYTLLGELKPKRYVEIGSGTTTKIAALAKKNLGLTYTITCIDPHPRKEITNVADDWMNHPLQEAPLHIFETLEPGDVLFFDGSHLLHANSDVQRFFLDILPKLKKGVIVQVHDIYLPYDYPQNMCDRFYAEQYILATALLSHPQGYELIAPAFYMSEQKELNNILQPLWQQLPGVETHGGSFWFRIR